MSFLNFEIQKRKPTKSIKVMPHLKLSKKCFWDKTIEKTNKKCNSYGFMKIWSNFNHSKIPSY